MDKTTTKMPRWDAKITFGKYKGFSYGYVAIFDPDYFRWLLTTCKSCSKWRRKMRRHYEGEEDDFSSDE